MKMKLFSATLALLLYIMVLVTVYIIHINYYEVDVVFYSAIYDGVIASLITLVIIKIVPYFKVLSVFEKALITIIFLFSGYIFAISLPTVLDRSLSFYFLEKIQQRGGGILLSGFETVFTKEYVVEHRLIDIRLTEQQSSGTIKIENGCVLLTEEGMRLASMSRWFRHNLLAKKRLIMGEYTDDLTHPFTNGDSRINYNYKCKAVD